MPVFPVCVFQNVLLFKDQDQKCTATKVQNIELSRKMNLIYTDEHY